MDRNSQKQFTIGVLAGSQVYYGTILGNFIGPVLHGVSSAARNRRCNLLLACGMENSYSHARPAWPVPSPDVDFLPIGPWNTDGLIVVNPLLSDTRSKFIQQLIAAGHPVVFITRGEKGPTIAIDNRGGVRQALLHLVSHGHRQIAYIAGFPNDAEGDSGIRLGAYQELVQEFGLSADPALIAYGNHGINGGQSAMRQIIGTGVPFTAVLASNDESAMGAMSVLRESHIRIPQDAAVIGIDDSPESITQVPPLTTIHSSAFRMGYQGLELLLDYLEGRRDKLEDIRIPMQLVLRQSCGCPQSAIRQIVSGDPNHPASRNDERVISSYLKKTMTGTVLAGAQRLSLDEVRSRCGNLVEGFIQSLDSKKPAAFRLVLADTIARLEDIGEDISIWHTALSTLESSLGLIREMLSWPADDHLPEKMVREAQTLVTQSNQRQFKYSIIHQKWITDQVGQLNARLLTALDEAQVYEILACHLPQMGIRNVSVAFFEADDGDPVFRSRLRKVSEQGRELRFPSRQFPPRELYPDGFRLAVLPMAGQEEMSGYVAFDADSLDVSANIVWQLVAFLKVARLYREATEGRRLAEEANRLKSRFLSTVSHELHTPLNLIVGLSDVLIQEEAKGESETHRHDLKRIHASAQHLDSLIQDVLDLTRNELGQLKLVCEPLDMAEALNAVLDVGEQLVREKGLIWQVSIDKNLPKVWGDRTRLRQVILNLIHNAVKFTPQGKVALRISAKEGLVTVALSDTGLGIPLEEQSVIFDEFRQSERTIARGYGGLGLGLAICKRLIEMHGGSIGVWSSGEEGAGSTFSFSLPAMENAAGLDTVVPLSIGQTVLLIGERSGDGERLRQYLIQRGYEVDAAWMEADTVWSPHGLKILPGAVVLEKGTALKQGWEILKLLRENPRTREIPVLFYSLDQARDSGSMLEMNYLTKPMNKKDLLQALKHFGLEKKPDRHDQSILIVDDDSSSLEMHARMVAMWSTGFRLLKSRNGKEALGAIREAHPNLVLLDLLMPELDGFGVLEAMQRDRSSRTIPVVVLTGQRLTVEDMTKMNRGVWGILQKNAFSTNETLAFIESALTRSKTLGGETRQVVRKSMAYLHDHFMEHISLKDAAHYVGINKAYLARCFRQEMGITLVTYLNRYRVHQAKTLLQESGRTLTEIALDVGFASSTYFSRVFRHETGISPSRYKSSPNQARSPGLQ
ncbi:MAG: substrate-binding domain-containing protein [Anaerolineales bacterium]